VRYGDLIVIPKEREHAAVAALDDVPAARQFRYWARFPFYRVRETTAGTEVEIIDARYAVEADAPFGTLTVPLPE
jgi:hypothetical protein